MFFFGLFSLAIFLGFCIGDDKSRADSSLTREEHGEGDRDLDLLVFSDVGRNVAGDGSGEPIDEELTSTACKGGEVDLVIGGVW